MVTIDLGGELVEELFVAQEIYRGNGALPGHLTKGLLTDFSIGLRHHQAIL